MAARDAAFTKLTTTNRNFTTQLRQQEDHIWALHAEIFNLEVAAVVQTTEVKGPNNGGVQPYTYKRKSRVQWPTDHNENKYNN